MRTHSYITTRLTQAKELGEAIVVNGKSAFTSSPVLKNEHLFPNLNTNVLTCCLHSLFAPAQRSLLVSPLAAPTPSPPLTAFRTSPSVAPVRRKKPPRLACSSRVGT